MKSTRQKINDIYFSQPKAQKQIPHLDKVGVATILFALRHLQANYDDVREDYETSDHIKCLGGNVTPLTEDEIGNLCELINTKTVLVLTEKGNQNGHN